MAEWTVNQEITAVLANQKMVYVGVAAPGTPYEGQFWVDISTDPPTVKVYDLTNTAWMTYFPVYYETQVGAWAAPTQTPITNGTIVVLYNSTQAGTRLYVRSNGAWTYVSTAISYGDWREHMIDSTLVGAVDKTWAANDSVAGYQFFKDVIINAGVTVTFTDNPGALVCKSLTIAGTGVLQKSVTGGAGGTGTEGKDGGAGGGVFFVVVRDTLDNDGTIQCNGDDGVDGTTTIATVNANSPAAQTMFRVGADAMGSGGDGGNGLGGLNANAEGGAGGMGGRGTNASGPTVQEGYYTVISDKVMDAMVIRGCVDREAGWDYGGIGGSEASATDGEGSNGGGGGSGGIMVVSCGTLDNTGGIIQTNGGQGGDAGAEGAGDSGGGGGAGGLCYAYYKTLTAAGTIQALGGAGGAAGDGGVPTAGAVGVARSTDVI